MNELAKAVWSIPYESSKVARLTIPLPRSQMTKHRSGKDRMLSGINDTKACPQERPRAAEMFPRCSKYEDTCESAERCPAGSDAFMLFFCSVYLITSIRDLKYCIRPPVVGPFHVEVRARFTGLCE